MGKAEARELTGRDDITKDEHPIIRLTSNTDAVLATAERAREVSRYLGENLDRWEALFGVEHD